MVKVGGDVDPATEVTHFGLNQPPIFCCVYLCWRHTYCQWPIIELTKNVSPKNKKATNRTVHDIVACVASYLRVCQ